MEADREKGEQNACGTGEQEDPGLNGNAIGKTFEPAGRYEPGDGRSYQQGQADESDKIPGHQEGDIEQAGAQYFSDTYLFRALDGADGG